MTTGWPTGALRSRRARRTAIRLALLAYAASQPRSSPAVARASRSHGETIDRAATSRASDVLRDVVDRHGSCSALGCHHACRLTGRGAREEGEVGEVWSYPLCGAGRRNHRLSLIIPRYTGTWAWPASGSCSGTRDGPKTSGSWPCVTLGSSRHARAMGSTRRQPQQSGRGRRGVWRSV